MAGVELFNTLIDYLGTRNATPTVETANIPTLVQSVPGKITKNPHATLEQVIQELASMTVDELNAQAAQDPRVSAALSKLSPTADYAAAVASIISDTTPRAPGTSTLATELEILLDIATRSSASKPKPKGR